MPNVFTPDAQKTREARALLEAAADGDAGAVASLLAAGAEADARLAPGGETPLMRASARGHAEVARALLEAGADASARRNDGFTPLILAVFFGHEQVVRLLLERGADPWARTNLGTNASRWAASRGFNEMATLLRTAEAARPRAEVATAAGAEVSAGLSKTRAHGAQASAQSLKAPVVDSKAPAPGTPPSASLGASAAASPAFGAAASTKDRNVPSAEASGAHGASAGGAGAQASGSDSFASNASLTTLSLSSPAAPNVSVRGEGRVPAHPSASGFRFGPFLRSWQGSVGVALLLLACAVSVFALLRGGGTAPRAAAPPSAAPTPATPQAAAAQPPAQSLPTPQPSPAFPVEPGQAGMPVIDPAYSTPNSVGPPFYVQPGTVAPVPSNAPRDLTVVSENGGTPAEETARPKRRGDAAPADPAPAAAPNESRDEQGAASDSSRSVRNTRPPDAEQQRPIQPSAPPAPAPAAQQPTPARAKVIQWPPQ